jgi:predicted Holliday junction resolvase-like endonuclease|tara:strand:- start:3063 stop:3428 length:366 start_codon:yes stop_codon:yes gene_type:complete
VIDYVPYALLAVCLYILLKTKRAYDNEVEQRKKLFSQKKSTEVRTGHIVEKFAPFLEGFPHDPSSAVFLGQPIDYIVFEDDGVTFSEIKSGKAQLSKKQRLIRDHIKEGRVFWEEIRVDDK